MHAANRQSGGFLGGMLWGLAVALIVLLSPSLGSEPVASAGLAGEKLNQGWQLAQEHLQGSILPFAVVLLAYLVQLHRLENLLGTAEPPIAQVARREQLLDLCANLFFGIGVIWTAIGMRDALLHSLGDPAASASAGAFTVLQRLVDGGILLALSTTIVGGIGGYLMRTLKSVLLGQQLTACYLQESRRPAADTLASLHRIEQLLEPQDSPAPPQ